MLDLTVLPELLAIRGAKARTVPIKFTKTLGSDQSQSIWPTWLMKLKVTLFWQPHMNMNLPLDKKLAPTNKSSPRPHKKDDKGLVLKLRQAKKTPSPSHFAPKAPPGSSGLRQVRLHRGALRCARLAHFVVSAFPGVETADGGWEILPFDSEGHEACVLPTWPVLGAR